MAGHNAHEVNKKDVGEIQEGDIAMLAIGPITAQFNREESGPDELGLGCWTSMQFVGSDQVVTRVFCGYNPCRNNRPDSGTV